MHLQQCICNNASESSQARAGRTARRETPRVGCFCKQAVLAMQPAPRAGAVDGTQTDPVIEDEPDDPAVITARQRVTAAAAWLAARWLPAPPWQPDPAWQDIELPDPPMPPEGLAVILALIQAQQDSQRDLGLDPTESAQVAKLTRIIATLNRRMPELAEQAEAEEATPWEALANQCEQADRVSQAARARVFTPDPAEEPPTPIAPWRPLLAKMKALAPLIAIGQAPGLNFGSASMPEQLAERLRKLRAVALPPLDNPAIAYQTMARFDAIARLQRSLGADPRSVPFRRVKAAVDRRSAAASAAMPPGEPPPQPPNPGLLVTPDTIAAASAIPPATLDRLRWQAPRFDQLSVLTTLVPVAKLVGVLRGCGIEAVRQSPCDSGCDAGRLRVLPGSGTGAAPAE
jgi:hypothetical protein